MNLRHWVPVYAQFVNASRYFEKATRLDAARALDDGWVNAGCADRGVQRAIVLGQVALERALKGVMRMFHENTATRRDGGHELLTRASVATPYRPAILELDTALCAELTQWLNMQTRRSKEGQFASRKRELMVAAQVLSESLLPNFYRFLKMPVEQSPS